MNKIGFILLATLLTGCQANAMKSQDSKGYLSCYVLSDLTFENGLITIEHQYTKKDAPHLNPENYLSFNFDKMTTTFFWSGNDGQNLGRTTEKLVQVNRQLFYSQFKIYDETYTTSYHLTRGNNTGFYIEDKLIQSFKCYQKSPFELERTMGIKFSSYPEKNIIDNNG